MADLAALQAQINQQAEALQAANAALEALQLAQQAQPPAAAPAAPAAHPPAQVVASKMIPSLSAVKGADWLMFIRKFRRVVELAGWNQATAITQLILAMNGDAYRAIQAIPTADRTLDEVVADFQRKFLPAAMGDAAIGRFEAARQYRGETLIVYHARVMDLYMQAYPEDANWRTNRMLIRQFSKGLTNERVMDHVLMQRPANYDAALDAAHDREATVALLPSGNTHLNRNASAALHAVGGGGCWDCGSTEHKARDCPHNAKAAGRGARPSGSAGQRGGRRREGRGRRDGRRDDRQRIAQVGGQEDHDALEEPKN